jgi:Protein phosphatase inhibitor 2 (IPP-2)
MTDRSEAASHAAPPDSGDDRLDIDRAEAAAEAAAESGAESGSGANGSEGSSRPKKKSQKKPRLQWDEKNLISNALEKERNNYPRIDEPKTPFHATASEGGSVSSGSAPGSPAFLSRDQLVGFSEAEVQRAGQQARPVDDTPNSAPHRSVHIAEDASASSGGDSSPRSRVEFETKRKSHYKAEFRRASVDLDDHDDLDDPIDAIVSRENPVEDNEKEGDEGSEDDVVTGFTANGADARPKTE